MNANYALYLVTDSTQAVLGGKDLLDQVRGAIEGGVTIVQYRDKTAETAELIRIGWKLRTLTREYRIPLIINDRVDVALAVEADGVHVGQDDMDLETARRLMGPDAIVGVSCSCIEEAQLAAVGGATYIGIGTVFKTLTKENSKSIIGTSGVRDILNHLSQMSGLKGIPAVVGIGGINASNLQRVMYQSQSERKKLDGAAVVSAIIASTDPMHAAAELRKLFDSSLSFGSQSYRGRPSKEVTDLIRRVPVLVKQLGISTPLCHNMTNLVVQNFAANVALAIGASPIMANDGGEAEDLAQLGGALVINMGSATPESISHQLLAVQAYNKHGGPVLFDPVGAGATKSRRNAVQTLMSGVYFHVIKGNFSEIMTVLGSSEIQQKGVDSGTTNLSIKEKAQTVRELAARERNVVLMTGEVDFLSDGERTYLIRNGHGYLGQITGSGCTLGTAVAAFIAVEREDTLLAVLAGVLMFEIAAERASQRPEVNGPGTFVPAFIDALSHIAVEAQKDDTSWIEEARVEEFV